MEPKRQYSVEKIGLDDSLWLVSVEIFGDASQSLSSFSTFAKNCFQTFYLL
jgi:hypothetical protein